MRCVIIDYGMGNLKNVQKACQAIGYTVEISSDPQQIQGADKLILPGVGAFKKAMTILEETTLKQHILQHVANNKPLLGICLGMQLLFEVSEEHGRCSGLGLLKGEIIRFEDTLKVPHMGWNTLEITKEAPLFEGVEEGSYVYFVHSYHLHTTEDVVSAYTTYGKRVGVAVQKDNVFGMQYHPEKSGDVGLKMLENFMKL